MSKQPIDLLPCPFCGAPSILIEFSDGWTADCSNDTCGVCPTLAVLYHRKIDAINTWNTRSEISSQTEDPCINNITKDIYTDLLSRALRAICFTRDYVGEDRLPPIEGWEWYDAGKAIAEIIPNDPWADQFWLRCKQPIDGEA